jgi:hypothetical protein
MNNTQREIYNMYTVNGINHICVLNQRYDSSHKVVSKLFSKFGTERPIVHDDLSKLKITDLFVEVFHHMGKFDIKITSVSYQDSTNAIVYMYPIYHRTNLESIPYFGNKVFDDIVTKVARLTLV